MDTDFASPARFDSNKLRRQLEVVAHHPVTEGVMRMVGGLIAVLNANRQILMVNQELLNDLKIDQPDKVFGLRPGETLGCVYASEMKGGCGTSEYCQTCGAAIAIMVSLGSDWPVERNCAISAMRKGTPVDLFFRVHASPLTMEGERYILLFLHDISRQQRLVALERAFFNDFRHTVTKLGNAYESLCNATNRDAKGMVRDMGRLTTQLARSVELQQILSQYRSSSYDVRKEVITVEWLVNELEQLINHHPAAQLKTLQVSNVAPGLLLHVDPALLLMVLGNMLINAFEATDDYRTVRLALGTRYGQVVFSVWNEKAIPSSVALRIFQRNFSTTEELGRGQGTFVMKLIGEQLLGGRVYFESASNSGTSFYLELPM